MVKQLIFQDEARRHLTQAEMPKRRPGTSVHGLALLDDGSIVFNFENSGLVKLDRCGSIVWTLRRMTHHSVERAESGGYWVGGRKFYSRERKSPFPPLNRISVIPHPGGGL